ncbi:FACT complex subunit Ssrp1 [Chrysoperla carnea]|uniref:FACT complex subunit Ssrp1 n=1 Tax=Chrysoperla carnea TaxID=189513 RepID=UPI001D08315A|nr:FACT complex subunit Ssrp1 [Chrysoperla carnea]
MDFLEYSDICAEIKGAMTPGRLKMTDQNIIFKNSKTGKVEQVASSEIDLVNFQKFPSSWGLRIFLKNGALHRFSGFKESEQEKIAKFFKSNYKQDMLERELSLKGWNWGTAKFNGSLLSFDVGEKTAFEIPLNYVSQCLTGKNEITMEFHQNDDAPVSLLEMRFHIPSSELAGDMDPVEAFHKQVMKKASVISVSGDAIAIFREIQCLTPRGRYDIKIFNTFFQLHGKTFDYKIPMSTVLRLFLLPHKDSRQMFFVVSLDPPIKQGQTRYHFLVLLFGQEEEISIELPFTEEELKEKYEDKLTKELSGPTYDVLGKVMKVIINRKLTGPGNFVGHSGTPAIGCSFKAAAGYLYPLERGFIYVHKPPIHIRFEEIASVNFARSGGSTRSFDFEIELKSGTTHTFSSIEKEEYGKLFDFITSKKLHVKNRGKNDKASYKDDFGDSDNEIEPDAYLVRVKAEAEERDEDDDGGDSEDESTDEDFNPNQAESDVAEEYDSNPADSDSDDSDNESGGSDKEKKPKKEKKEKPKSAKTVSEKPRKKSSGKKDKDSDKPKKPQTAFMIWMNANREKIKSEHPGLKVTEIAKKAGELWKTVDKSEWEEKVKEDKIRYQKQMEEYLAKGGGEGKESKGGSDKKSTSKKPTTSSPPKVSGVFKSKEIISDDSSSDSDASSKPAKKKTKTDESSDKKAASKTDTKKKEEEKKKDTKKDDKKEKDTKKKKDDDEDDDDEEDGDFDEEEVETTPPSSDKSDDDSD